VKKIIISAVNVNIGGTAKILKDCLEYLSELSCTEDYEIVALVHKKEIAPFSNIRYIELPWAKKMWINRLFCEYIYMYFLSKSIGDIYLWLSLHDTTPNVKAHCQAVYCHNSFPFYKATFKDFFLNYKIVLFSLFSKYIYKLNLKRNQFVIVQQQWMRHEFMNYFNLKQDRIIVTPPKLQVNNLYEENIDKNELYKFIYPATPNSHKNFECLCEATKILESKVGKNRFHVYITITGEENKYSKWVKKKYGKIESLKFVGFLNRKLLYDYYAISDCLVFPSKVESWGLPISEFAFYKKPMLIADKMYAHETAAGSTKTIFFDPNDPNKLYNYMKQLYFKDQSFLKLIPTLDITPPTAYNWNELFKILLNY